MAVREPSPWEPGCICWRLARRPTMDSNDPCPCGTGKKYKKCHGRTA